jgi:multidrug efflux pump subunit AcrA (membrane-fusion protein)
MHNKYQIKWMIITILITLSLTACSVLQSAKVTEAKAAPAAQETSTVSATGIVVPKTYAALSMAAPGKVEQVFVIEGQSIEEGQELMKLSDRAQNEAALAAAQLELASAQKAYDDFLRYADTDHAIAWQAFIDAQTARIAAEKAWQDMMDDNIDDRIADREVDVQERKDDLDTAQEDFDKYKDLDKDNATRKRAEDALDTAQKDYDQAVWDLESTTLERDAARAMLDRALAVETEAKRQYERTLDAPDADNLALLEARLTNAKAQVKAAQVSLDNLTLLAPFTGTIAVVNIHPGEWASPGQPVLVLADLDSLRIETTDLNEIDVAKIHLGDTTSITFDALPGVTISGVVTSIAPKASTGSGVNYTVVIEMDEIPDQLSWGMTATVDFEPGK